MTTMLKRVENVLCELDGQVSVQFIAKAVVEAMREPTEIMKEAASEVGNVGNILDGWAAMIEAALKEDPDYAD